MTPSDLERKFSDMIAFQCVLVGLRGVGVEASEEMLWQTLLAALVDQYGFRRVWYGRRTGSGVRPTVVVPLRGPDPEDLPMEIDEASPILRGADLALPLSVEGAVEGILIDRGRRPAGPRTGRADPHSGLRGGHQPGRTAFPPAQ